MTSAVQLDGRSVEPVSKCRILGQVLDNKLNWESYIEHVEAKTTKSIGALSSLAGSTWGTSYKGLRQVYQAIILPQMTYAAMAVLAIIGIPYVQLKFQPPGVHNVSPAILLPFIAALTSAAAGGVVCNYCDISAGLQVPVIIVSYLEVGAGIALAIGFDGVVFQKHFNRNFPTQEKVYQDMILCGPFGQGSFALQGLGKVVMAGIFADYNRGTLLTAAAAKSIGYASQFAGLLSWGYGTFWWCFAIISILQTVLGQQGGWRKIRYGMSAWSLIFPWVSFDALWIH